MDYSILASRQTIEKALEALKSKNVNVVFVETKEDALEKLKKLIPDGAEIMTGSSVTLEQIGFVDLLKSKKHPWNNLKDAIVSENESQKQVELRKRSILSRYFIGSVHAITQEGEVVVASASGSQIPSYAFSSDNVIWVAGAQKIVPTLEDGLRRVREYVLPLEDQRMKKMGYEGSSINKILIFIREIMPNRKITLILINEKLGF